jgi:hypothetical protein
MTSKALAGWQSERAQNLDELVAAHQAVGGTGPGRRYATAQINDAYLVAVAGEFQAFCRDLHSEAAAVVVEHINPPSLQPLTAAALTQNRQLDRGNAHSGSVGADFGRFDLPVWDTVRDFDKRNAERRKKLDQLNTWRNAIAHRDFTFNEDQEKLLAPKKRGLGEVRGWRAACDQLAQALDRALAEHLEALVGTRPW